MEAEAATEPAAAAPQKKERKKRKQSRAPLVPSATLLARARDVKRANTIARHVDETQHEAMMVEIVAIYFELG